MTLHDFNWWIGLYVAQSKLFCAKICLAFSFCQILLLDVVRCSFQFGSSNFYKLNYLNPCFRKANLTKRATKCKIEVFKCLRIFNYTPNIFVQDWEIVFTKTFKTFRSFISIDVFCVKRRIVTIKINIWIAFRIDKINIQCKRIVWNGLDVCARSHLDFS